MKEYIKLYQKMREEYYQKWGEYAHPQNWRKFEEWQQKNNFPKGEQFYEYPENLSDANRILQSSLPVICFINVNRKLRIDAKKFTEDLSR